MPTAHCSSFLADAAAAPASIALSIETLLLIVLGLGLMIAIWSLVVLHRRVNALTAKQSAQSVSAPASGAPSPEILAVITAAVIETIGFDHRIVAISTDRHDNSSWSHEGRRQVFASRKVR